MRNENTFGALFYFNIPGDPGGPNGYESETKSLVLRKAQAAANKLNRAIYVMVAWPGGLNEPYTVVEPETRGPKRNPKKTSELEPNMWLEKDAVDDDYAHFTQVDHKKSYYHTIPLFNVEYAGGSDYSGGTVTKANYDTFLEMKNEENLEPFILELTGHHSSYGIAIRLDKGEVPQELLDAVEQLEDYPILDEEHLSEVEMEREGEDWESWGRSDWLRALRAEFIKYEEEFDDPSYRQLDELWHRASQKLGWSVEFETGGNAYFNFKEGVKKLDIDDLDEILIFESDKWVDG